MIPDIRTVDPGSAPAQAALRAYLEEIEDRFATDFGLEQALRAARSAFRPPRGSFLLAGPDDDPVACGAVQWLDDERGEIKRMWVAPAARGRGVASALLAALEEVVRSGGRTTVVLDTNGALTEAVAMYGARGYLEVPDYNGNPHATHWFAKHLTR